MELFNSFYKEHNCVYISVIFDSFEVSSTFFCNSDISFSYYYTIVVNLNVSVL